MTVQVTKTASDINEGINYLIDASKEDYAKTGSTSDDKKYTIKDGQKFMKIIRDNSVHAFIVKQDMYVARKNLHLKAGDVLKPASWRKPALNKARGNVLTGGYGMNWTGPLYLR